MARHKRAPPTDGELEILKHIWDAGPCELGRLCALMRRQRPVATTTVATMLTVMLGKGLVKRSRGRRGYLWSAKIGRETTTRRLLDRLIDQAFNGSAKLLVVQLVESKKLSEKDRRQVLTLLEQGAAGTRGPNTPQSDPPGTSKHPSTEHRR